ncbi:MAG: ATP synthase subunit I [Thermodesulfobacteriota bacterium]
MADDITPESKFQILGVIEKLGLIVTAIIVIANILLGYNNLALGAGLGGVLFILDFIAIKFLVNTIFKRAPSTVFIILAFFIKLLIFVLIVASLIIFAKINIYGFFIGVTGILIVIIGQGLRGNLDGSL